MSFFNRTALKEIMNIQNLKLNALLLNSSSKSFEITDEDREWINANTCNEYSLKDDIFPKKNNLPSKSA